MGEAPCRSWAPAHRTGPAGAPLSTHPVKPNPLPTPHSPPSPPRSPSPPLDRDRPRSRRPRRPALAAARDRLAGPFPAVLYAVTSPSPPPRLAPLLPRLDRDRDNCAPDPADAACHLAAPRRCPGARCHPRISRASPLWDRPGHLSALVARPPLRRRGCLAGASSPMVCLLSAGSSPSSSPTPTA